MCGGAETGNPPARARALFALAARCPGAAPWASPPPPPLGPRVPPVPAGDGPRGSGGAGPAVRHGPAARRRGTKNAARARGAFKGGSLRLKVSPEWHPPRPAPWRARGPGANAAAPGPVSTRGVSGLAGRWVCYPTAPGRPSPPRAAAKGLSAAFEYSCHCFKGVNMWLPGRLRCCPLPKAHPKFHSFQIAWVFFEVRPRDLGLLALGSF